MTSADDTAEQSGFMLTLVTRGERRDLTGIVHIVFQGRMYNLSKANWIQTITRLGLSSFSIN